MEILQQEELPILISLSDETNPTPVSVFAKGKWVKRDGKNLSDVLYQSLDWEEFDLEPLELDWELNSR